VVDAGEACDDGNIAAGDGCSATCQHEPVSIDVSPEMLTLNRDQFVQLHLVGTFADGTIRDLTGAATWSGSHPHIAAAGEGALAGRVQSGQAGAAVVTARLEGHGAEVPVSVRETACTLVINEVQTAGETAADEWIELYNGCSHAVTLTGWRLVYRSATATGSADSFTLVPLTGEAGPGEFRLYASSRASSAIRLLADAQWGHGGSLGSLARTGGAVGLRASDGSLVDSVGYGQLAASHPFVEGGRSATAPDRGAACVRGPFDGADSNVNEEDFLLIYPPSVTPRSPN
jgi:cysteine-rich repeat protein